MATTIHEMNDRYSDESVELYREWAAAHPNIRWTEASVDRYDGLMLSGVDSTNPADQVGLHFACALCGYGGSGPIATVDILEVAGFGPRERLEAIVFKQTDVLISR